jgi:hypothetical protein
MSDTKDKEAKTSQTFEYKEDGVKKSIEIKQWSLGRSGKNLKLFGGILVRARKARPELDLDNLMQHIDVIMHEGGEDAILLIRNSFPREMSEETKNHLMDDVFGLADGVRLLGVIIRLNFLSQAMQEALGSLYEDPEAETEQTGQE